MILRKYQDGTRCGRINAEVISLCIGGNCGRIRLLDPIQGVSKVRRDFYDDVAGDNQRICASPLRDHPTRKARGLTAP